MTTVVFGQEWAYNYWAFTVLGREPSALTNRKQFLKKSWIDLIVLGSLDISSQFTKEMPSK